LSAPPVCCFIGIIPAGEGERKMGSNVIEGAAFLLFVIGVLIYVIIL
jgi:hypothetical protein